MSNQSNDGFQVSQPFITDITEFIFGRIKTYIRRRKRKS